MEAWVSVAYRKCTVLLDRNFKRVLFRGYIKRNFDLLFAFMYNFLDTSSSLNRKIP